MKKICFAVSFFAAFSAVAGGPWLDKIPEGGIEIDETSGYSTERLRREMDSIEKKYASRPLIVTRTEYLKLYFDHVRLAVNTNDLFVHWHPDTLEIVKRTWKRLSDFRKSHPSRANVGRGNIDNGTYTTRLDLSHTCPDWNSVIKLGPRGLADRARERRKTADTESQRIFLDCVAGCYDALARQCLRWADVAERKGMREVAAVLRENAAHEPRTFREALQWSLVYDRAQELEGEDVRSQGLFDRLFIDYYRADISAGRETRESAKRLLADYYTRLGSQGHPNGKNIAFGGYDAKGESIWNELTELGFEVFRELGRINPKLTYRFGRKTPREHLEKVTRCLAEGKTSIVFACEETLTEAFLRRGAAPEDINGYLLVGCYEPGIGGREIVASMAADINLLKPLEAVFNSGRDFSGVRVGLDCPLPENAAAFEKEYLRQLDAVILRALETARAGERSWCDLHPAPLFSGSFADCIASGADYSRGGCKYNSSGIVVVGLGTAADSLAAIKYLVDERRLVTMKELSEILRANWKGHDKLRATAQRGAPKWGNGDDRADLPGKRIYDFAAGRINGRPNGHGGRFNAGFWSIYLDMAFGKCTAATPDGRLAGEPLSRNNVATSGCGTEGPTAVMNSNLKLDQANSPNGHIMDIVLPASLVKSKNAASDIADILMTYFERGGQCIHLNCFDSATLRAAMAEPAKYSDLQVRVCGWNVRWIDLSRTEQLHFLATVEAQESGTRANR